MKKYLFIWLIIFTSAAASLAQDIDKTVYQKYSVQTDGFSIDVPQGFNLKDSDIKEDKFRLYGYYSPELYLFIKSDKDAENSLNETLIKMAVNNNATVTNVKFKKIKAKEYKFTDEEGFHQRILIYKTKTRNLIFHSVSSSEINPAVNRFFSTLKFDQKNQPEPKPKPKKKKRKIDKNSDDKKVSDQGDPKVKTFDYGAGVGGGQGNGMNRGQGDGSGLGLGPGNGNSGGSGNGGTAISPPKAPETENVPFKLLSKPRPSYTDLARSYYVTGTVRLRVSFLANGQIGTITVIKSIPFGLTNKAIDAAKSISFEPPKKNGVAYPVAKLIDFNFMIY